jgi:hypothetical protein
MHNAKQDRTSVDGISRSLVDMNTQGNTQRNTRRCEYSFCGTVAVDTQG